MVLLYDGVAWMKIDDIQLDADEIWNLAIEEAAKLVSKNYDSQEPWIEPDEIRALKKPFEKKEVKI